LHLKEIAFESISVHLVKNGGEQHADNYVKLNPSHLVPTLVDGDFVLNQSLAIIDYIDQVFPTMAIYPSNAKERAKVYALALDVACEVHPVNNLRIQQYLVNELALDNSSKLDWVTHWITTGFQAIESQLAKTSENCCFGNKVTLADICLIPQVYNAKRFGIDMSAFPNIDRISTYCNTLPAFIEALPENQPDAL
jgi:maleylacetoacetate isomerase/maleylpyruvate isomerase